ncbi:MAG: SpoIIE family protein phosphatase [Bacteroidales bacterium]|nr:SpoIIE family protein phosphatase [Bacteroidales bacterium]
MPKYLYIYTLLFLLFPVFELSSQPEDYSVEHYSIKNGLSQYFVTGIYQDKFGYIWFGTQDGLNKFDGYEFKIYRQDPSQQSSISHNNIIGIEGSKDSILWIVTNDGLEKYNFNNNSFTNIIKNRPNQQSVYSTKVKTVLEDESGILWIRTIDGIIQYIPDKNEFLEYKQTSSDSGFISDYNYFSLIEDNKNNLWTGSKNGLIKFNKKTKEFELIKVRDNIDNEVFYIYPLSANEYIIGTNSGAYTFNPISHTSTEIKAQTKISKVRAIFKDKAGILWVGTEFGLMYLDNQKNILVPFNLENYISDETNIGNISDIYQDKSDILWICSGHGIFKIDYKKKYFKLYRKEKDNKINFSSNTIFSIYYDNETDLVWLGTRGFGLNTFNRNTNKVKIINKSNSALKDDNIFCIKPDNEGNIWIGTNNGPVIYNKFYKKFISFSEYSKKNFNNNYFTNNRITDILFDKNIIWFSTLNGLLKYHKGNITSYAKNNSDNSIISNDILKILKRKNGEFWIATLNGLSKFDLENETFTNYTIENNKISNNSVLTVFESSDQTLWLGTGTGLNKYIPEKDSFVYYTSQSHGFNNDFIYTIVEDENKNLWMSTNRGIIRFNLETEDVSNFSVEDNLQGYEFNIGAVYYSSSNEIFWGGTNGLNSLKLDEILENYYSPQPILTSFFIRSQSGKKEVNCINLKEIFLTYNESSFDIHFAVPEYTNPYKNKFKYRILESDKEWIDLSVNNSINFYQLAPGDYTFQLIGANGNNQWNLNPVTLKIHISSPWWQTTVAYILYVFLLAVITGGGFFVYSREIRKENKILHEKQIVAKKVEKQRELLTIKNNSISESMRYASGIINALLPAKKYINDLLPDSFVLFMSKEIVSGDFYWFDETEDKIFAAAVDCTGHGVPGAFMSIIGLDLLRNILDRGIESPAKILDELNKGIATVFMKDENSKELKDGMDISIITIHKNENIIEYAGAVNQIYIIRDDNIIEYKGDRFSVSPANYHEHGKYTNHIIEVKDKDMIYLFSDGYVDQFGGPDEKKFKYRRFRHMLLNNYQKTPEKQKNILKRVINTWRGTLEQVDDILVMGIKINKE